MGEINDGKCKANFLEILERNEEGGKGGGGCDLKDRFLRPGPEGKDFWTKTAVLPTIIKDGKPDDFCKAWKGLPPVLDKKRKKGW